MERSGRKTTTPLNHAAPHNPIQPSDLSLQIFALACNQTSAFQVFPDPSCQALPALLRPLFGSDQAFFGLHTASACIVAQAPHSQHVHETRYVNRKIRNCLQRHGFTN
jgi:hypothetical protein